MGEALHGVVDVAHRDGDRVGRQVIEQGGGLLEEQGQVILDAGERDAVADVLVRQGAGGVAFEHFAKPRPEAVARLFVHGKLAAGQQLHFAHRIQAALRVDVEAADRFDLVVEQVQPVGHHRTHGKQVDQAAAQAEFARRGDLGNVAVVGQRQLRAQGRFVEPVLLLERKRIRGQEGGRRQAVQGGGDRHGQDVHALVHERVQRAQALRDQVLVGRERVVGQGFPVGQLAHAQFGRELRDFIGQPLGLQRVGRQHHQRLAGLARQVRQQPSVAGSGRAGLRKARSRLEGGQGGGGGGDGHGGRSEIRHQGKDYKITATCPSP
ncbi:Uncharacterised protein [Bordetella pertussis]|nr:Uncharacterised protein [Bordetella pertussis]CFE03935.1 Uncharacterised protein [Bordetella pertussis]CFM12284.1 Uncharacterised protein [Bordetella pertussis]CFM63647.1 Uncharacterised protein [Bordetella pertussis]CFM67064.1 Uncharacterised protein [Bordetella pertussis]